MAFTSVLQLITQELPRRLEFFRFVPVAVFSPVLQTPKKMLRVVIQVTEDNVSRPELSGRPILQELYDSFLEGHALRIKPWSL